MTLQRVFGALCSPAGKRARLAVFCFHQVLERPDSLRPDEPCVDTFRRDIELIGSVFNVLALPDAVRRLREGTLPARAACITFDDGYLNNLTIAAPVLEQAGMPATFFVAGGAIDAGIMWNDLVIEAMRIDSTAFSGIAGEDTGVTASTEPDATSTNRVIMALKYKPLDDRWRIAESVYREVGDDAVPRLMMTRDEVRELAGHGFDIGGHTLRHPILSELPDDQARDEIEGCMRWVEQVAGKAPTMFAYPNGKSGRDFDDRHEQMARQAGFEAACSTDWRLGSAVTDPYSIPRVGPWWRYGGGAVSGLLRNYVRSYL